MTKRETESVCVFVCLCVRYVCVSMCVRERETEERETESVCVFMCVFVCKVCVCECV